ncbi:hypothetical protein PENSPDRAFT_667544 [Peniophora sp. CONT]|nr:hypothetical protein PENSPDRAFT_667544 [Peniophora sp. CONT]
MGIFRLRAVQSESNDTIAALLSVLFDRCQGMNVLVLHLARPRRRQELEIDSDNDEESDEEEPTWTPPPRREFLRWSTLQQLHFPELTRLEITHEYALAISDDNITVLARNLRNLEVLDLNAAPGNADADPGSPIARFQRLECLFLCTSPIQETERETTTLYLARVLPTDAILTSDREYVSEWDYTPPVFEPERRAIWKRIETDLRLILNAKRDWLKDALQQDSQTTYARE